jgi:alkaline phosphatase D
MDRRAFLRLSGAGAGLVAAARLQRGLAVAALDATAPFGYGVASGDPLASSVIVWTRVTPGTDALPGSGVGRPLPVEWQVASDERFRKVVRSGRVMSSRGSDHTIKADVSGLEPDTTYHYRFRALGEISPAGSTRTAPPARAALDSLRFGLASCSNYEGGYFAGYRYLAERDDLAFVLHMGDYLYEYAPGAYGPGPDIGRVHEPDHEIVSLADYRIRHALYKTDPDLQSCHAAHPFVTAWDDHEVTNDTYRNGAENHQPDEEGKFGRRRRDAYRAYFEWMPIRLPSPGGDPTRIYRRLQFGRLADLHMLDTRQYRHRQAAGATDEAIDDPERTITGDPQMAWLKKGLSRNGVQWRLVGTQVQIAPVETGEDIPLNVDTWDGYRADRQELLQHLVDNDIPDVAFLTGDIHSSWACDVPLDATTYPVTPSACVELVGTSITSDNLDEITGSPPRTSSIAAENGLRADNPHIKYVELDSHGYSVVEATPERLQMDWYYLSDRTDPEATQQLGASWQTVAGSRQVTPASEPI